MQPIQTVRGMHDFLPTKATQSAWMESIARQTFSRFAYREIRTPAMENAALFERAIGQTTDIVEKEMFTLKDRGDRLLCLRPEGTAGVVRAFIEHHLDQESALQKLFYIAPMFRAERPQAGRYREFFQIGCEYFGDKSSAADAESIVLLSTLLNNLGAKDHHVRINSIGCENCRPQYQQKLLTFLDALKSSLCADCQRRMDKNPLRALDCKIDQEKFQDAPCTLDHLCADCQAHQEQLVILLDAAKINFVIDRRLVRGLDYYTRSVFEVYARGKSGSQDALAAGGRYDHLVRSLGGPQTPAVGFAMGLERVLNFLEENAILPSPSNNLHIFICALGQSAVPKAFGLLQSLRAQNFNVNAALDNRSLKSQMRLANASGARFCAILGEDEIAKNEVTLKDLQLHTQTTIPFESLADQIKI